MLGRCSQRAATADQLHVGSGESCGADTVDNIRRLKHESPVFRKNFFLFVEKEHVFALHVFGEKETLHNA